MSIDLEHLDARQLRAVAAALAAELEYDRHDFDPEINPATGKPSIWCSRGMCGGRTQANDRMHRTPAMLAAAALAQVAAS